MTMIFWPGNWLFIGAGAIMLLAAARYQWRVWRPFRNDLTVTDEYELSVSWLDRLRRRRWRRARRAEDLTQAQLRRQRWQTIMQVRQAFTLAHIAWGIAILATLLALWDALRLPVEATTATLWSWEPLGDLNVSLTIRVDDLSRWLGQITLAIAALAFITHRDTRTRETTWGLVALGAFVHALFCLDLIAFLVSWVLLDVALLIGFAGSVRSKDAPILIVDVAASTMVTLAMLWAMLMIGSTEGALLFTRASPILLEDRVLGMFLLAAVFRMALYPFHLRFRHATSSSLSLTVLGHLLPLTAGFYLLARLYTLASGEMPGLGGVQTLGTLSLIAGAVLIWRSPNPRVRISYAFLSQTGLLVMVLTWATPEAVTATLVGLVSLILAACALFVQDTQHRPTRGRIDLVLLLASLASLTGIPPTLGFWGRWMSYNVLLEWDQAGMLLLALGCHVSVMVALLRALGPRLEWNRDPVTWEQIVQRSVLGLLILPLVLLGFWPPAVLMGLQPTVALITGVPAPSLSVTALAPTADALTPWITLGGLLLSLGTILWLGGWLRLPRIDLARSRASDRWHRAVIRLCQVLDLAWVYRLGWNAFVRVSKLLADLTGALDGHYALVWIVLLGFALGLFLLGNGGLP